MSGQILSTGETPSAGGSGHSKAPRLELTGPWLEAAGFPAGARVEVEVVEPGRLVVTRRDAEGPVPSLLPLVWIPAERLAALEETRETAAVHHG